MYKILLIREHSSEFSKAVCTAKMNGNLAMSHLEMQPQVGSWSDFRLIAQSLASFALAGHVLHHSALSQM